MKVNIVGMYNKNNLLEETNVKALATKRNVLKQVYNIKKLKSK